MASKRLMLSPPERRELSRRLRSRSVRFEDGRRADVILRSARGQSVREIARALGCSTSYVQRWTKRFRQTRLSGLVAQHRGRQASANAAALEAKVLEWTRRGPDDGSTHWSSRRLARKLGIGHMSVARIWSRHGLQPHRLRHFMASNDPAFEAKAADIIGLYLAPPAHAAVFCVDEKSAIEALDRLDPVLPLSPGRAERHGFEYFRHGTLSLYAALETRSGQSSEALLAATPARSLSAFSKRSWPHSPPARKSISSWTTSPPTKPRSWIASLPTIQTSRCITRPLIVPGSTRSKTGSPKSSAT